jgi:DNA primase
VIPDAFLDELRSRTSLSALIGGSVKLIKAGREHKGCCPFHNEKSPSFYVNDEKGFYHCFGCSVHGDAIRWLTDYRGMPFMDAVKELSAAAGMEVPAARPGDVERDAKRASLYDVNAAAAKWYTEQLHGPAGSDARAYLEKRGIKPETAIAFGMGFAPDNRTQLKTALASFGDQMLIDAGLVIAVDGRDPYDRFRKRIMFPIRDARGRICGFGGRILGDGEPKYLNSPQTSVFDKGRLLFNCDRAAPGARKSNRLLVVEGYLDVISLDQAGLSEVVAPNGTALTEEQMLLTWRLCDAPTLCFDGDKAGRAAANRAAQRALPGVTAERTFRFAFPPEGMDPDDLVRQRGLGAIHEMAQNALSLCDMLWRAETTEIATPEARAAAKQRLIAHCNALHDRTVAQEYRDEFRRKFDAQFVQSPSSHRTFDRRSPLPPSTRARNLRDKGMRGEVERSLLATLLASPAVLAECFEPVSFVDFESADLAQLRDALVDLYLKQQIDGAVRDDQLASYGVIETAHRIRGSRALPFFKPGDTGPSAAIARTIMALAA